jgi:hypothetical protein
MKSSWAMRSIARTSNATGGPAGGSTGLAITLAGVLPNTARLAVQPTKSSTLPLKRGST